MVSSIANHSHLATDDLLDPTHHKMSPSSVPASGQGLASKLIQSRKRKNDDDGDDEYEPSGTPNTKRPRKDPPSHSEIESKPKPGPRREPHGQPLVWSEKRASLAAALPYYKSHQGSLYTSSLVPYGILVDAQVGTRDHFSSQVIITSL